MLSQSPSLNLRSSSPVAPEHLDDDAPHGELGLSVLPPFFILGTRTADDQLRELKDSLNISGAPLADNATAAQIFLSRAHSKKRAAFELRAAGVWTDEVVDGTGGKSLKRRRLDEVEESDYEDAVDSKRPRPGYRKESIGVDPIQPLNTTSDDDANLNPFQFLGHTEVLVLRASWIEESIARHVLLGLPDYVLYHGRRSSRTSGQAAETKPTFNEQHLHSDDDDSILTRARGDTPTRTQGPVTRFKSAPHGKRRFRDQRGGHEFISADRPALLQLETRSSQEESDAVGIPPAPDWVRQRLKYSCQRITPMHPPNEAFMELLKKIRLARLLTSDEIGVRAYSSAIAAIAAVPTTLVDPKEILRLPSCDVKIANFWVEYKNTGTVKAAEEVDTDDTLKVLNSFYEIWGVGASTAREFHFEKGWQDIDDIVEYGWDDSLNRVQQIGIKYYDEFQQPIPRAEIEGIVEIVRRHAVKVRDEGIEILAVGGYRRGKEQSGDCDLIISHRDFEKTANLVTEVVNSLEEEGWITHTLRLDLRGSRRGQDTVSLKAGQQVVTGTGFDTLDKAMVVWQDLEHDPLAETPNLHRRVDIIVSPWRTVGCAVLGWSAGTTFERDIRRYCKYEKGWKFDSSGIRNRRSGEIIRLEGTYGVSGSMEDAERTVFAGMGLIYREPWERCTG